MNEVLSSWSWSWSYIATDSQSASKSCVRRPSGTRDQFFFLLEISFRLLRVCYFVAPSLTRGRVCNLLYNCFWSLPEQSLLGQSPSELTTIFYCLIWDSPNLEGQVPVFISPRNRVAQLYPRELVPFLSPLTTWKCQVLRRIHRTRARERTIPTERPPHVDGVSANLLRIEGATWSARWITLIFSYLFCWTWLTAVRINYILSEIRS
jgi:hypothetical protein